MGSFSLCRPVFLILLVGVCLPAALYPVTSQAQLVAVPTNVAGPRALQERGQTPSPKYTNARTMNLPDGGTLRVSIHEGRNFRIEQRNVVVELIRLPDGDVYVERTGSSGITWSAVIETKTLPVSTTKLKGNSISALLGVGVPTGSIGPVLYSGKPGQTKYAAGNIGQTSYAYSDPGCLDQYNDPICMECGVFDSLGLYGSAVLAGAVCGGSFGSACAAGLLAFGYASENYMEDCAECNDKYPYFMPPAPCEEPPDPESAMFGAWETWSYMNLWALDPPSPLGGSVYTQLNNAVSNSIYSKTDSEFGGGL